MKDPNAIEKANGKPIKEPLEGEVMPSDVGGAPTKYTPQVVSKLVAAFHNGYNITEACQFAGIARETYYDWQEKQVGFSDKMSEAQQMVNRVAKEKVVLAIKEGDAGSARWWLERKDPEFKSKAEVDNNLGLQQTREKIKEFLDEPTDYDAQPDAASTEPPAKDADTSGDEVASTTSDIS